MPNLHAYSANQFVSCITCSLLSGNLHMQENARMTLLRHEMRKKHPIPLGLGYYLIYV